MKQKILYIIRGEHTNTLQSEQEHDKAIQCDNYFQLPLIIEIAKRNSKVSFFCDMVSQDIADQFNFAISRLVKAESESEHDKILGFLNYAGRVTRSNIPYYVEKFAELQKQGIIIDVKKTEEKFDELKVLEEKLSDHAILLLAHALHGYDPELLHYTEIFAPILMQYRDTQVYRNICGLAGETSALFMGRAHPLKEFKQEAHGFKIYDVNVIFDNGVKVSGTLPEEYRKFVQIRSSEFMISANITYES